MLPPFDAKCRVCDLTYFKNIFFYIIDFIIKTIWCQYFKMMDEENQEMMDKDYCSYKIENIKELKIT